MPKTHKILIIDDDAELCEALKEQLSLYEEFNALVARTASEGFRIVRAGVIDLVIMDIGLPDVEGHEAVRILRRNGFKAPVIMLSGRDTRMPILCAAWNRAPTITSSNRSALGFYLRAFALSFDNIKQAMIRSLRSAPPRSGQALNSSTIIAAPKFG
jgi:DNA-binding NarL/FixJ family response regulator